jgi:RNA polymerase sigma factor (TIGR02999 family)
MPEPQGGAVTRLLLRWRRGDREALDELVPLVYEELRRIARRSMRSERTGHTLEPTALVHEAFARLVEMDVSWQDRAHFLGVAARAMRRILVDHARSRGSAKRGGGAVRLGLDEAEGAASGDPPPISDLDEALRRLSEIDPRKGDVVEMTYFGGLTQEEVAEVLGLSVPTVQRELRQAKAWLYRELR